MKLKRMGAYVIDAIAAFYSAAFITYPFAAVRSPFAIYVQLFAVYALISLRDIFGGQSLGRKLLGIKVVFKNCANADVASLTLRNMFLLLFPIELILLLVSGKRLGDAVTGMTVVKAAPFEFKNSALFIRRGAAFFIDCLIFMLILVASFIGIYILKGDYKSFNKMLSVLAVVILTADIAALLFRDIIDGRSLGKRIMGIKTVGQNGRPPKPRQVLVRDLLSYIWPVEAIALFVTGKRIADIILKTDVTLSDDIKTAKDV